MANRCSIDIETYSSYDLSDCGVYKYIEAPDFEILIIGFSVDGGEVRQIDMLADEKDADTLQDFIDTILDPDVTLYAFNAAFERLCINKFFKLNIPPERWRCTMIKSLSLGLPGSLAGVGEALGLPEEKLKDPKGKALIRYFSVPCKPSKANGGRCRNMPYHDPDKWRLYLDYNRQDVVTEMEISGLIERFPIAGSEWELWYIDQTINDRGIKIDVPMVCKIVDYDARRQEELKEEAKGITGLSNPNSTAQLKSWLISQKLPFELTSVDKEAVTAMLSLKYLPDKVRRVLEIRQALGKTSVKKFSAMLEAVCADSRLHGTLQFYGANRTGRWAGRLVQVHNLARNSLPDLDLARELVAAGDFESIHEFYGETSFIFSELVRTAFIPEEGYIFTVSDFSAIEARVLAWLAGEKWVLDAFKDGKDIYCETASMMYKVPVEKHGANAELRQKGKIATLACGYQGGIGAMKSMDKGGSIPEEELQSVVDIWRRANPRIVKLWYDYEKAAKIAIKERRRVKVRQGVAFEYSGGNLFVWLPSGRRICYWNTRLVEGHVRPGVESIVYKAVNQTTKQWADTETYGGKIAENITQATARDCLAETLRAVHKKGYRTVMHVHDEVIVETPIGDAQAAADITEIMSSDISWAPGLPLKGDTYQTPFYKKD